ncbi:pyridoxal phosphate-dependent aminotransferase [Nitratifractor sp.]|uniref:pyridoxal phosphate-dependent aminotransferase n=1 Tax=Nitratifractor sp. TaxID=2268144 RepID=UPI0025E419EE|nr:pyridoxal phosphate-dependent aminotransferase [Nitratifractor sp.]
MFSKRINALSPSMTIAISSLARDLKAQGKDVLSFSAGEPDFNTPQPIKDAAIEAIREGFTKYTAVAGIPELLDAVAGKLERENGLKYDREMILTSNGAKQSLFNLTQALIDEGDEVIIPAPYWVTYPELVKYAGGVPVVIEAKEENRFKITPEQLEAALSPRTKLLILNSPSNPTGSVYSRDELAALGRLLEGTDVLVASDEMYEKLLYDGAEFVATAGVSDDLYRRTVTINGLSKAVAMTGWRFGYLACPDKELVKKMTSLQSQSTSNICSITQKAAIPALEGKVDEEIEQMRRAFEARAHEAVKLFNEVEGLSVLPPQGAFYLFVNIKEISNDSMKFCEELLSRYGVAVVPGIGFGMEGYFRFSFATDIVTIREGIRRIEKFVKEWAK